MIAGENQARRNAIKSVDRALSRDECAGLSRIRSAGLSSTIFDRAFVTNLGRAYESTLHGAGKRNVTLGRDCRVSSPSLREWLLDGQLESGITVVDVGWSRRCCST